MADWSASITVKVADANVGYIVEATDPDALGVATISGEASLSRLSGAEPLRKDFQLSLTIRGLPAAQAKAKATVWPALFDEVTANENVIGIVLKANEHGHRRGEILSTPLNLINSHPRWARPRIARLLCFIAGRALTPSAT